MSYIVNWTEETKSEAIRMLTKYLKKYGPGECIMQGDNALIEAPEVMAGIADLKELIQYIED
jgi:hypothetical protein